MKVDVLSLLDAKRAAVSFQDQRPRSNWQVRPRRPGTRRVALCDLSRQGSVITKTNDACHMIDRRLLITLDDFRHDDLRILNQERQLAI